MQRTLKRGQKDMPPSKIFRLVLALVCALLGIVGLVVLNRSQGHLPGPQAFALILGSVATLATAVIVSLQMILNKPTPKPARIPTPQPTPVKMATSPAPASKEPQADNLATLTGCEVLARLISNLFRRLPGTKVIPAAYRDEYRHFAETFEEDFNLAMWNFHTKTWPYIRSQIEYYYNDTLELVVNRNPEILAVVYAVFFFLTTRELLDHHSVFVALFLGAVGGLLFFMLAVGALFVVIYFAIDGFIGLMNLVLEIMMRRPNDGT